MAEAGRKPKKAEEPSVGPTRAQAARRWLDNSRGLAIFCNVDVSRVWHWPQDKPIPLRYAIRYVLTFPDDFPDATAAVLAHLRDLAQQGLAVVEHADRIPHSDDDTGTK
jgi:hypothetical protein